MNKLIEKLKIEHDLSRDELIEILKDNSINEELYKAADELREKTLGDAVHLRALIEFTNICARNCMYCGLRKDNKSIKRYRLSEEEIVDFAQKAVGYGFRTIVLQGGEDAYFTKERLVPVLEKIKALGVAITLSLGERPLDDYVAFKKAGADRFLLRIETTDPIVYKNVHPGMSHENRKRCLDDLRTAGYEVGSGSLVGLPGQTIESLADDLLYFKELDVDMLGIGPFIPNGDTPLKDEKGGELHLALKMMALIRLLLPDINIPATTAMETLHKNGRVMALQAGANVVMPNVTEGEYRSLYQLYPGKISVDATPIQTRGAVTAKILGINRSISDGHGFRDNGEAPKQRDENGVRIE